MREGKAIIVSKETLVIRGLIHYIHAIIPEHTVEIFASTADLISGKAGEESLIFINPEILETPREICLEKIYRKFPSSCFIALSANRLPDALQPYFELVLSPADTEETLLACLKKVCITKEFSQNNESGTAIISEREKEILRGVALGLTNKEISDNLNISAHTVITHRKNISAKLGIKTIAGLAVYAVLNGVISADEIESKF